MVSLAVQCMVISPVCGFVCLCLWVCYHDNSKLRASIFTKLVTISSWLNFGHSAPQEGVCGGAEIFGSTLLQPARSVCASLSTFHIYRLSHKYCSKCNKMHWSSLRNVLQGTYRRALLDNRKWWRKEIRARAPPQPHQTGLPHLQIWHWTDQRKNISLRSVQHDNMNLIRPQLMEK